MPARKKASKKTTTRKKTTAAARKKGAKKPVARKKVAKKPAARKKAAAKKPAAKKKAANKSAKKPAAPKKAAAKKPAAKKKAVKKESVKKAAKKAAAKKALARKTAPARKRTKTRRQPSAKQFGATGPLSGFTPYRPKAREDYMSDDMLDHFQGMLLAWKRELMEEVDRTVGHMKDEAANFPDPNDRATQESEFSLELRTRDRERKLLRKIDSALQRIDDGSYGYCAETGEEIGLQRLEARPVATLSVEAQERRELAERQYRDRDER